MSPPLAGAASMGEGNNPLWVYTPFLLVRSVTGKFQNLPFSEHLMRCVTAEGTWDNGQLSPVPVRIGSSRVVRHPSLKLQLEEIRKVLSVCFKCMDICDHYMSVSDWS